MTATLHGSLHLLCFIVLGFHLPSSRLSGEHKGGRWASVDVKVDQGTPPSGLAKFIR